jgi:ATP-dependent DNA ligase
MERGVIAHDYEGLVAKDETSLYEAGPTRRWLKVKQKGGPSRRTGGSGALAAARSGRAVSPLAPPDGLR